MAHQGRPQDSDFQFVDNYIIDQTDDRKNFMLKNIQEYNHLRDMFSLGMLPQFNGGENPLKKVKSQLDVKQEERIMTKNESSHSLKEDVMGLQNIKGNVKNAYIKKINSLLNVEQEEEKDKPRQSEFSNKGKKEPTSSNSSFKNAENDDLKMQKNRESARNSRQRKKLYIGLLEKKVEDLNNQIEGLRQQCESSFKHIHTIVDTNPCLRGMIIEQAQIFDQLQKDAEQPDQVVNNEMQNLLVDSYKLKFSATGSKRKAYIKYCFQNIAKNLLEGNYGPLLFGQQSQKNCIFFYKLNFIFIVQILDDDEFNDYVKQFKEVTGLTDDKYKVTILGIIRKILDHKKNFKKLIKDLKNRQKSLRTCQQQLEDITEDVTNTMTTQQFVNLLLLINKKSDQMFLKEEYPIPDQISKIRQEQQIMNQYKFVNQYPLDLLINSKNPMMFPPNIMIDPLHINDLLKQKYAKP